ncbi:uncharacterized protein FIBRA_00546 [Fibroporia radiculosa]|uniref:Uncharacterized protein n=1 Tax=Fibroporia radiculosa TaxID=599839 RepID=J4I800_9APHY|nr:uncharacterized protein FIBRA_00546 [Fibroporia radiculosa]CCL98546.1 predicted protein [Fibroporia radiculosa]
MGFFSFLYQSPRASATETDPIVDLTTLYPPRNPAVMRRITKEPHIPIEIVMNILETAYDDDEPESNVKLFASCALVCRDWSFIAQKLLFRHVTLDNQTAYIAFQHAVDRSSPRGRMLGDSVMHMRLTLDHNQPYRLSQRSFARAVTFCPNLLELRIALFGEGGPGFDVVGSPDSERMKRPAPSFDERTLALLRTGPSIQSLHFSNWSDNSSSLCQLLDIWPTLKSLSISGVPPQLLNSAAPFPCPLEELRMNFQTAPSVDFMKWLLHNSTSSLRTLEMEREPPLDLLEHLISEHGASLQSLALPSCGGHDAVAALQRCDALRELRIESAWAPPVIFKSLSDSVEHIAFGIDADTPLQPLEKAIKRSEGLRAVTLHIWHGGHDHPQLNAVKVACARRGIELRITEDIRVFRVITRGVLDSIPRPLEALY